MADTAYDKVHVVNSALNKLGLSASYSIDDENEDGGKVDRAWDACVAEVMMLHAWQDMMEQYPAQEISGSPETGWQYGFTLPATRVGDPVAVLQDPQREDYLRHFMLMGGRLYANVKPLWVRVRVATDPQYWDLAFREAFAVALASHLAVPMLQDAEEEERLWGKAFGDRRSPGSGGAFGVLLMQAKAAQPQGRGFLSRDPLTQARRAGVR